MPVLESYEPSALSFEAIREYAWKVVKHHGLVKDNSPVDLDKLVDRLRGEVVHVRWGSEKPFSSSNLEFEYRFTVNVPELQGTRRDRFAVAHAVGHFYLHALYPKAVGKFACFGARSKVPADEKACVQANVFAAALLLPKKAFVKEFSKCHGDTWALADRFFISPMSCEVMAEVLHLKPEVGGEPVSS